MYAGYLIQVGGYTIPLSMIRAETYKVSKTIIDVDATRDANGILHRNAQDHVPYKVEFNVPQTTNYKMNELMSGIKSNFINAKERKALVTIYVPEDDAYITQEMYMPDIDFTMYAVWGDKIHYKETRLAFIGY